MDRVRACHVLGVTLDANQDEIRKAYKRKALETHPDKLPNGDATLFKEVATAYAVLTGQTSHMEGLDGIAATMFTPEFLAQVIKSIIAVMGSGNNGPGSASQKSNHKNNNTLKPIVKRKPKTIHVDVKVTLEDLYKARIKKLSVKVKRWDQKVGVAVDATHVLYVSLLNYQPLYKFKGVGDELENEGLRGNIVVHVDYEEKDPVNRLRVDDLICKHDLYMDHNINLYEYYTATCFHMTLWHDVVIQVPYTRGARCAMIENAGMPYYDDDAESEKRGNLYVFFELVLPDECPSADVLSVLSTHFVI